MALCREIWGRGSSTQLMAASELHLSSECTLTLVLNGLECMQRARQCWCIGA